MNTKVLATSRSIRDAVSKDLLSDQFLKRYISISEFFSKSIFVDGYKNVDEDTRLLNLLSVCDFERFSSLHIERSYFSFMQNSQYIFKFLEELSVELVEVDELIGNDVYALYDEHLQILKTIKDNYEKFCNENKILDRIFLPKLYKLNTPYIKSLGDIELEVNGYLSRYELKLLEDISKHTNLVIVYETSKYNTKVQDRFKELGFELEQNAFNYINLSENTLEIKELKKSVVELDAYAFEQRGMQVAFVKEKIASFIKSGIKPSEIVIITPEESFANVLKDYDYKHNLNLAKGVSLSNSIYFKKLSSVCEYIDNNTVQNVSRANRVGVDELLDLSSIYYSENEDTKLVVILESLIEIEPSTRVKDKVKEQIHLFKKFISKIPTQSVKTLLKIFINRLSKVNMDDVGSGKITVMGILETRGVHYKGVIVVDFNEDYVPKSVDKDMFLNSQIREFTSLPSKNDRESLQKLLYLSLFEKASKVAISYVKSDVIKPSKFLKELKIRTLKEFENKAYSKLLFKSKNYELKEDINPKLEFDFRKFTFSPSSIKNLFECRRRFYYKYIEGIKSHEIPSDSVNESSIGIDIHNALKKLYENKDYTNLHSRFDKLIKDEIGSSELEKLLLKLWSKKLTNFFVDEEKSFLDLRETAFLEDEFKCEFEGFKIKGRIDRIDKVDKSYEIFDYKTGKYPSFNLKNIENTDDFQLDIYYLLCKDRLPITKVAYYDLANNKIVASTLIDQKIEILKDRLSEFKEIKEYEFFKCEDIKKCTYCDYVHLCERLT